MRLKMLCLWFKEFAIVRSEREPTQENEPTQQPRIKRTHLFSKMIRSRWIWLVIVVCIAAAAYKIFLMQTATQAAARAKAQNDAQRPLPVMAVAARKADMDVNLRGLGTVIPVKHGHRTMPGQWTTFMGPFQGGTDREAGGAPGGNRSPSLEVQLMQPKGSLPAMNRC